MEIAEINKLGKELEIYTNADYIGKGFPIMLPKGAKMIRILRNYVEYEEEKNGYKVVRTPSVSKAEIYKIEDRYDIEKKSLFTIQPNSEDEPEDNAIVLKPYVQPFHCSIYNTKQHTYKELPEKYCETSTIFRNEKDLKGISRARQFTLSDISDFCIKDQLEKEIKNAINMQKQIIDKLNLNVIYTVQNWNENKKEDYIGQVDEWKYVTDVMKKVLTDLKLEFNEDNNAKMYGPAIFIKYNDMNFSTLQVDFEIVHRFDTKFVNRDNEDEFPIYFHMTAVGSYENIISILIERYRGKFPFWIAPTQVEIISEGDEFDDYANEIRDKLLANKIRAEIDNTENNFQNKQYKAIDLKIPYIVLIGKEEYKINKIKVRKYDETKLYKESDFIKEVLDCQVKF